MALQVPVDRGYLNLLAHLREDKHRIPLETLQAAICHYLVHLPPTQPTPTPFTASVIASPIWHPLSLKTCLALTNTFRASVREVLSTLKKVPKGLFVTSLSSEFATWTRGILAGLKDGNALLRLAISGGLHLGTKDTHDVKFGQRLAQDIEETMVLAFAEAMEATSTEDQWAAEFNKGDRNAADLAILLAAQFFNSISTAALTALNLLSVVPSLLVMIEKGFASGSYLHVARACLLRDASKSDSYSISTDSTLDCSIETLLASESFTCIAFLCRLLARTIAILSDTSSRICKRRELWDVLSEVAQRTHDMAGRVEDDWSSSPLADVRSDAQLDEKTKGLTEKIWFLLKTQLFSTLMLQQAILDTILFHPPPPSPSGPSKTYSPVRLTSTLLKTLSSLSFVIASFGGVTAGPAEAGMGPSFPELKNVFYVSVDILCTDSPASEAFVRGLVRDADASHRDKRDASSKMPFVSAKWSFALSCIEQFILVLHDTCIEEVVVPFCEPHLNDPSDRQTYEAAHSVMLSIFAAHAENCVVLSPPLQTRKKKRDDEGKEKGKVVQGGSDISLATRLVPGYAQILLQNAKEGGLTTAQLRLAYAALVRSASTGRNAYRCQPASRKPTPGIDVNSDEGFIGDPALAWLCVEELLRALMDFNTDSQTRFALSLTLVSLLPNVGLLLLPRLLEEMERVIDSQVEKKRRMVLIENVFEEILERVGHRERELVMNWYFEMAKKWERYFDDDNAGSIIQEAKL